MIGPTVVVPLAAFVPVQLPLAVQEVGVLVALQVTVAVALAPAVIVTGFTEIVTLGTATTVRVTDLLPDPALLLQLKVYVNVPAVFMAPVDCVPLAPLLPLQPVPLAVQEVGLLVALQLMVELLPVPIDVGDADIVTTGGEVVVPELTLTLVLAEPVPPAFEQLRLYVNVPIVLSAPVL